MTQKEKARAYDEALKKAKEIKEKIMFSHLSTESCKAVSEYIDTLIPELAESEDERIRKNLIELLLDTPAQDIISHHLELSKVLDYLEKQKERKNYRKLYEDIAQSEWFKKTYTNKSLGEEFEQKEQEPISFNEPYNPDDYEVVMEGDATGLKKKEQKPTGEDGITNGWKGEDLERYLSCLQRLGTGNSQQPETINSKWFKEHCHPQSEQEWSKDYREEAIQTRFAFYTYKDDSSELYLSNVFVEEASRNHGFGTKILRAAEKVAETIGATTICLKVKQDSPANAWYRKNGYGYVAFEDGYDWLEKNLEYMKPQPKQEWSNEDERKYQCIRNILLTDIDKKVGSWKYSEILEWYERRGIGRYTNSESHWKPSEEQMEALKYVTKQWEGGKGVACPSSFKYHAITELYEQLKKLM